MSFMDKVKAQAEQAMVKGQAAVKEGQTKLTDMQAARPAGGSNEALLRNLGAAYYAEQRSGGSPDATAAAIAALDAHAAAAAQAAAAPPPPSTGPAPSMLDGMTPPPVPPAGPAAPPAPTQSFGLDDV